jgi:hypothetical protein
MRSRASSREALAALGATTIQNFAATLGSHSRTKSVGALALDHAGLKGSFHDISSS